MVSKLKEIPEDFGSDSKSFQQNLISEKLFYSKIRKSTNYIEFDASISLILSKDLPGSYLAGSTNIMVDSSSQIVLFKDYMIVSGSFEYSTVISVRDRHKNTNLLAEMPDLPTSFIGEDGILIRFQDVTTIEIRNPNFANAFNVEFEGQLYPLYKLFENLSERTLVSIDITSPYTQNIFSTKTNIEGTDD